MPVARDPLLAQNFARLFASLTTSQSDDLGREENFADVYAFRGESDKAFDWFERAFRERDVSLMFVKIDPLLKGLRRDPRYADLFRKMHLPT